METINNGSGELYDGYNKIEKWDGNSVKEIAEMYYKIQTTGRWLSLRT